MRATRFLGILGLLLLTFGLWRESLPRVRVRHGITRGAIGGLPTNERDAFLEALTWIESSLPARQHVELNDYQKEGALRVLTVTKQGYREFGCDEGNAVYDSRLDAILIDVGLVRNWLKPEFGTAELFSTRKAFTLFLLLHEIGHRLQHGSREGRYAGLGSSDGDRLLEQEADSFGLEQLDRLAGFPLTIPSVRASSLGKLWRLPPGAYGLYGFDLVTDLPDPDSSFGRYPRPTEEVLSLNRDLQAQPEAVRRDIFFLALMQSLPRAAMRADNPYSSLHHDRAHGTLVQRIASLLTAYLRKTGPLAYPAGPLGTWGSRQQNLGAVTEQLRILDSIGDGPLAEITLPGSIVALAWEREGLLLLTDEGYLFEIERDRLPGHVQRKVANLHRVRLVNDQAVARPAKPGTWSTIQADLWTDWQGRIYCYTDDGVHEVVDGYWQRVVTAPLDSLSVLSLTRSEPSGSRWIVWTGDVLRMTGPGGLTGPAEHWLEVLEGGSRRGAQRRFSDVFGDVAAALGTDGISLGVVGASDDALRMSIWNAGDESLIGVATFDLAYLTLRGITRIHTGGRRILATGSALAVLPSPSLKGVVAAPTGDQSVDSKAGARPEEVEVMTFDSSGQVVTRARVTIPYGRVLALLPELPEAVVDGVTFINEGLVVLGTHGQSPSFVVDLSVGSSRPLFFPSSVLTSVGPDGWAAYVPLSGGEASLGADAGGNYRCYIARVLAD